jgi:hypothetical protein
MPVLPRRSLLGRQECCCYINDAKRVAGVGIAPTSADLQPAAHLSEPSSDENEMVPPRGDAPRSAGYRPAALLLSYGGEVMRTLSAACEKLAEHQRIAAPAAMPNALRDWSDALSRKPLHSGRLCGAQRFSGPFPRLCRTCSFENGSPAWTCTMTIGLTGRQAPLPHRGKMRMVPAPGFEPGTAAVRSGACKMFRYTLRACV